MQFPIEALVRHTVDTISPGSFFRHEDHWYYRLPEDDLNRHIPRAVSLTDERAGRIVYIDAHEKAITVGERWRCVARTDTFEALSPGPGTVGSIALGPRGVYLVARDHSGGAFAYPWGETENLLPEVNDGALTMMSARRWHVVVINPDRPGFEFPLFTVDVNPRRTE